ncbi:MAG: UbiA family prenyltransferase [Chloroflexota bacterium]
MREWSEFLHLRAIPVVVGAALVFVWVASSGAPPRSTGVFVVSLLLTQVAIAFHNNWCDRDLDAATKPWRLIPRGALAARTAHRVAWLLFAIGLGVALPLGPVAWIAVATGTASGFVYNGWLKRSIWSFVPFCVALPTLPVAAFIVAGREDALLAAMYVVGAPLVIAIHLADALPDIARDRAFGLTTLAVRLGVRRAYVVCWAGVALAAMLAVAFWPANGRPGPLFVAALGLLVVAMLLGRWPRVHRVVVPIAAVALAADWLRGLVA